MATLQKWLKNIGLGVLFLLGALLIYHICAFIFGGGIVMGSLWKVCGAFWFMFKTAFLATFLSFFLPVAIYALIVYVAGDKTVLRIMAGLGGVYFLYWLSGDVSFSLDSALNLVKLAFQLYFLILLVLPEPLVYIAEAVACAIGSIAIILFPDLPGSVDDMGAIGVLITMVLVYMNILKYLVKKCFEFVAAKARQSGKTG
jgi:hypothetical protein